MGEVRIKTHAGEVKFEVEVARTDEERQRGLMYRKEMPESHGMLFIDEREEVEKFWMKNTFIPLDMVFIDSGMVVRHICHHAEPCGEAEDSECPLYSSAVPVRYCLEIGADLAKKNEIEEGCGVEFDEI